MRKIAIPTALLAAGALAITAALAGCGDQRPAPAADQLPASPAPGSPAPGSPATGTAGCLTPKPAGPFRAVTITERDNGKSFCVQAGTDIFVLLHGTPARLWGPIRLSSPVLQRRVSGVLALMRGETGGFFTAARLGSATVTSTLAPCPGTSPSPPGPSPAGSPRPGPPAAGSPPPGSPPPGSPPPGSPRCTVLILFRVTVLVRGRM